METFSLYEYRGEPVYTQEYIQSLRDLPRSRERIIAQLGGQENMLASQADITIGGGMRGGSKTYSLLLEGLKDVSSSGYRGILLRNEKPDLEDMIEVSYEVYGQYGTYNKSQNDMTWNFNTGAKLRFSYYADSFEDFKRRFQGKQFAFIGIDEITHCPYNKFKYLLTDNRNAYGLRSRFWGTCNPDPDSWVAKFIDWWIGEDGLPIKERDGVVRYCYMKGDEVGEIVWGDSKEEVYELCKEDILKHWTADLAKYGSPMDLSIFSVCFVEAKLADNAALMNSDPQYIANLMNQSDEQQARDLDGNWKFRALGDDMIKMDDMVAIYNNSHQYDDKDPLYATADIAFQGGDNFVMWLWKGWHIKDVMICRADSKTLVNIIKAQLSIWGVEESHLTYDLQGVGQYMQGFFPDAVPFNNQGTPIAPTKAEDEGYKNLYKNLKSQCAFFLYRRIRDLGMSIEESLLDRRFDGHGYGKTPLKDILMRERKCIRRTKESEGKAFCIISKSDMKKIIGHSPDFFESLIFRQIFDLKGKREHKKVKNLWCI